MNTPWQALIFDWDGTLMDSEARIVNCLRTACVQHGLTDQDDAIYKNVIGLGLREAIRALHPTQPDALIEQLATTYRNLYMVSDTTPSALFPGVTEMLQTLESAGYWLAIATGKGREGLNHVLQQTGLEQRFHITRCASETRSKPHPQMLEEILDQLGLHAHQALMIGDTEYDMEMAHHIGMDALAVSYGVHAADRLLQHPTVGCLHNIAHLPIFLSQFTVALETTK